MHFDDTREARIYREEAARTKKATAKLKFSKGQSVSLVRVPYVRQLSEVVDAEEDHFGKHGRRLAAPTA
ncbi:hypothetical protein [Ochrobactrum sp. BTU1]|jgi:hypothetical protein|uniref:hypothetical protein n=1 Tax=Ochrobactrum sp. BTU1 TaxID=2840456 RepID=UPI001C0517C4|nr:hypothetical protein KMS41_16765 [Ochrobactrum sp. BTU1]